MTSVTLEEVFVIESTTCRHGTSIGKLFSARLELNYCRCFETFLDIMSHFGPSKAVTGCNLLIPFKLVRNQFWLPLTASSIFTTSYSFIVILFQPPTQCLTTYPAPLVEALLSCCQCQYHCTLFSTTPTHNRQPSSFSKHYYQFLRDGKGPLFWNLQSKGYKLLCCIRSWF